MRKSKYVLLNDENWLRQKYEVEQLTAEQIAEMVGGASKWQVLKRLNHLGISTKRRSRKYPLLDDEEWLQQKYEVEKLSIPQIAKLVGGANCGQVTTRLRRLKVDTRRRCRKYPLLNDKDWLQNKYENEKLSSNQIGVLVGGASCGQINQRLKKCGIKVRTKSEGHVCQRKDDGFVLNESTESVIVGAMLGDGNFWSSNKESDGAFPCFRKNNIHYDHIKYVAELLYGDKWQGRVSELWRKPSSFGPGGRVFATCGLTRKELMPLYRAWYPPANGYKKVIPEDAKIDKIVLLHWFLDDGYSYRVNRKSLNGKRVYKYVPYGGIIETMPYLIRRLYENNDILKHM